MVDAPHIDLSLESQTPSPSMNPDGSTNTTQTLLIDHTESVLLASAPPPCTFKEMGIREEILKALDGMGFKTPFPVQVETYQPILAKQDLIVQARTGSGKTAAFGIPLMQESIDPTVSVESGKIQCLILVPTRELALQVHQELERMGTHLKIKVVSIYGGAPMGAQLESLAKGAHIVVGTPGRVLDHLRRGSLDLTQMKILVLDEADEMLSRDFYKDITEIIQKTPPQRQTLVFSATMPFDVERLCEKVMCLPVKIQLSSESVGALDIQHSYYMVSGMARTRDLLRVLDLESPESTIVFCNTREETREVTEFLRMHGLDAKSISGNLTQKERERVMALMRANKIQYLVATDIAARGIDISHVTHVINYTFPDSPELYIHRTGRTGRAGRSGSAISLIGPRELASFYAFKLTYKIHPAERAFPTADELQSLRERHYHDRLQKELLRTPAPLFFSMVRSMLTDPEGERRLAVLVERYVTTPLPSEEVELAKEESSLAHSDKTAAKGENAHLPAVEKHSPRGHQRREPRKESEHHHKPLPKASVSGGITLPAETKVKNAPRPSSRASSVAQEATEASSEAKIHQRKTKPRHKPVSTKGIQVTAPHSVQGSSSIEGSPSSNAASSSMVSRVAVHEPIQVTEGREYWEAWVDSRQSGSPMAPAIGGTSELSIIKEETLQSSSSEPMSDAPASQAGTKPQDRKARSRRKPTPSSNPESNTLESNPEESKIPKVYLNLGKRHGFNQERLQALLSDRGLASFPVQIRLTHSYLIPPEEKINEVVAALNGFSIENRTLLCERARK